MAKSAFVALLGAIVAVLMLAGCGSVPSAAAHHTVSPSPVQPDSSFCSPSNPAYFYHPFAGTNATVYPGVAAMEQRAKDITRSWVSAPEGEAEAMVEQAWLGYTGIYESAADDWEAQYDSGHAHPGDNNPPRGGLIFFNTKPLYGDVAIYLGKNQVLVEDMCGPGRVDIASAGTFFKWVGGAYLGWSDPVFNGVLA